MSKLYRDYINLALECGVTSVHINTDGVHPKLVLEYHGQKQFYVFPHTSGDRRSFNIAATKIRRMVDRMQQAAQTV